MVKKREIKIGDTVRIVKIEGGLNKKQRKYYKQFLGKSFKVSNIESSIFTGNNNYELPIPMYEAEEDDEWLGSMWSETELKLNNFVW
jgi:hypothetical protein